MRSVDSAPSLEFVRKSKAVEAHIQQSTLVRWGLLCHHQEKTTGEEKVQSEPFLRQLGLKFANV
ncbi:hypothetical protein INR49_003510 [Caranx melampygus]|nr:hypothetical protein INR49_003510 [Caranx melampygus]